MSNSTSQNPGSCDQSLPGLMSDNQSKNPSQPPWPSPRAGQGPTSRRGSPWPVKVGGERKKWKHKLETGLGPQGGRGQWPGEWVLGSLINLT